MHRRQAKVLRVWLVPAGQGRTRAEKAAMNVRCRSNIAVYSASAGSSSRLIVLPNFAYLSYERGSVGPRGCRRCARGRTDNSTLSSPISFSAACHVGVSSCAVARTAAARRAYRHLALDPLLVGGGFGQQRLYPCLGLLGAHGHERLSERQPNHIALPPGSAPRSTGTKPPDPCAAPLPP